MHLRRETSPKWLSTVRTDVGRLLQDHAACEKKAMGTALSLAAHYPDKPELVREMIELAQEELQHYAQAFERLQSMGLSLGKDEKDPYVHALLAHVRRGTDDYFLDRLLVFGVIEARGCERFRILADGLDDPGLCEFYRDLAKAEAQHSALFVRLARRYFASEKVEARLSELLEREAELLDAMPVRVAFH